MQSTKLKESLFPMPPFVKKHIEYLETRIGILNEIQHTIGASNKEMEIITHFCDTCIDVTSVRKLVSSGQMTLDKFKEWKQQREAMVL